MHRMSSPVKKTQCIHQRAKPTKVITERNGTRNDGMLTYYNITCRTRNLVWYETKARHRVWKEAEKPQESLEERDKKFHCHFN